MHPNPSAEMSIPVFPSFLYCMGSSDEVVIYGNDNYYYILSRSIVHLNAPAAEELLIGDGYGALAAFL